MVKTLRSLYLTAVLVTVVGCTHWVTTKKFIEYEEQINQNPEHLSVKQIETALDCLALNIYREAATEPFEGKVAVAQVTINRTKNKEFPSDICQVVYQKNIIMKKVVCQFSWYCDRVHRNRPINKERYDESYQVAKKVMLEGFKLDVLDEALYYHADYVRPNWKHVRITKIGKHIFYKERV